MESLPPRTRSAGPKGTKTRGRGPPKGVVGPFLSDRAPHFCQARKEKKLEKGRENGLTEEDRRKNKLISFCKNLFGVESIRVWGKNHILVFEGTAATRKIIGRAHIS
jgi:hypothetical protein